MVLGSILPSVFRALSIFLGFLFLDVMGLGGGQGAQEPANGLLTPLSLE